jgi:hypothetical protein
MTGRAIEASVAGMAGSMLLVATLWALAKAGLRRVRWREMSIRVFGSRLLQ